MTVAAVVLAAGRSRRLGRPKQLVEFGGEPLVRRAARVALDAALDPVVVVIAAGADAVRAAVPEGCAVVENPVAGVGMATSVRAGVAQVRGLAPAVEGVVLMTCDQPLLDAPHLRALVEAQRGSGKPLVASEYAGIRGVPVLVGAEILDELSTLEGDRGARDLVRRDPARVIAVPFAGGELDIDRAQDLEALAAHDVR